MTWVHGRSPLGYLRRLRGAVIAIPILTFAALAGAGRRYAGGAFIDPESAAIVKPSLVPLWAATVLVLLLIRIRLASDSSVVARYICICVAYLLALATSWTSLVYSLTGASPLWGIAGYILAIMALSVVSLSRYAVGVSTER
jgi:hypothetical protein